MSQTQWVYRSNLGPIYLVASNHGLQGVFWTKQKIKIAPTLSGFEAQSKILAMTSTQLDEYFEGRRFAFDLPLIPIGTDFQKKVWEELLKIPYGETCSYQDLARKINNERATRAVGSANGKNPLCIVIPCHRVISSNGSLGGYSGGLHKKSQLLKIEGWNTPLNPR